MRAILATVATIELDCSNDRVTLLALAHFDLNEDGAYPSYRTLAATVDLGESTVRRCVSRLKARGLIMVTKRCRKNGSQTSNRFTLTLPGCPNHPHLGAHQGAPASTPEVTTTTSASNDSFLSGSQARGACKKLKSKRVSGAKGRRMQRDFDAWEGETAGAIDKGPTVPTGAAKIKVHSGDHEVVGRTEPAVSPGPGGSHRQLKKMRLAKERADTRAATPVADWTASDLANAWRERLWKAGHEGDLSSLKPLAARFSDMKQAGATSTQLDAVSAAFFADPRKWGAAPGQDMFKVFINQTTALLHKVAPGGKDRAGYYGAPIEPVATSRFMQKRLAAAAARKAAAAK